MEVKFKGRLERGKPGAVRILYEADQRHAEILMRDRGIDESSKGVVTPGVNTVEGGQTGEILVGGESLFRAVAARGNYLGQDRMDMQSPPRSLVGSCQNQRNKTGEVRRV